MTEKHKQSSSATKQIQFLPVQSGVTPSHQQPQAAASQVLTPGLTTVKELRAPAQPAARESTEIAANYRQTAPVDKEKNDLANSFPAMQDKGSTEQEEAKEEVRKVEGKREKKCHL